MSVGLQTTKAKGNNFTSASQQSDQGCVRRTRDDKNKGKQLYTSISAMRSRLSPQDYRRQKQREATLHRYLSNPIRAASVGLKTIEAKGNNFTSVSQQSDQGCVRRTTGDRNKGKQLYIGISAIRSGLCP